jgi:hypothetical protein
MLFFTLITGCMVYNNLNTKQINTFKKELKAAHKGIKKLEIKYSVPSLYFIYSFKKTTEDEMFDIFYKTKELILNEDFQKDFFEKFFNTYFKEDKDSDEKPYPSVSIDFDLNNDGEYEYQFESMYYKHPYNSGGKNEIDGYKTWAYWDFKSESKPVPEKEEKK